MDSEAQTRAYAEADFDASNSLFTEKFKEYFKDLPAQGSLVDLGCGPGDISIRMACQYPGWTVIGLDAGINMLKFAQQRLADEKLAARVSFQQSYLPDPSLAASSFDSVISNSLLHHLPQPQVLWQSIVQVARPGAAIQVMDLMRPDSKEETQRLVDTYASGAPQVLIDDFYNSLLAAYTRHEISDQLLATGLDRLKIEIASDRHWIVHGRIGNGS